MLDNYLCIGGSPRLFRICVDSISGETGGGDSGKQNVNGWIIMRNPGWGPTLQGHEMHMLVWGWVVGAAPGVIEAVVKLSSASKAPGLVPELYPAVVATFRPSPCSCAHRPRWHPHTSVCVHQECRKPRARSCDPTT
eukprot:1190820-Prorocentrum_minimum.AAC.5